MAIGIRVIAVAGTVTIGTPGSHLGEWVKLYDPDGYDGVGEVLTTNVPSDAHHFPDLEAAMAFYRQVSTKRPHRADGQPNRPLTALTVSFEKLPEEGHDDRGNATGGLDP
jgi:hypothetical protein